MATVASFKKYDRGSRIIAETAMPVHGMNTIHAPIQEGYCHTLVNYTIAKDGSLCPRPGIAVQALTHTPGIGTLSSEKLSKMLCKPLGVTAINEKTKQEDYTLIAYDTDILCVTKNGAANEYVYEGKIKTVRPTKAKLSNEPVFGFAYTKDMSRPNPIYTFGQNGSFYYFETEQDTNKTVLKQFRYDVTDEERAQAHAYTIEPKNPAANEILLGQQSAYNMLKEDPYTFEHYEDASLANKYCTVRGITLKDADGNILFSPKPWQKVVAELYFNYHTHSEGLGTVHAYEVIPGYSEPVELPIEYSQELDLKNMSEFKATVSIYSGTNTQLIIKGTHPEAGVDVVHDVFMYGITYDLDKESKHMPIVNYDLTTCEGMSYWNTQLVLYKLPEDPTLMFFSVPNDPSYFPYPMNTVQFEEPILTALPLLDSLIVFTRNKIYQITKQPGTQAALIKTCLQQDMQLTDNDVSFITPVKNMLFFKSGNYFYMIVPNRKTLTGELVVTNVSKNISSILDTYKAYVTDLFEKIYLEKFYELQEIEGIIQEVPKFELVETHSHLDFEDVHNVLVLKRKDTDTQECASFLHVDLLYNTVTRTWRIYLYDAPSIMCCSQRNATNNSKYVWAVLKNMDVSTRCHISDVIFDIDHVQDVYIEAVRQKDAYELKNITPLYNNIQYFDSGILELNTNFKKRFREIQIKLTNTSQQNLRLNTGVSIDGTNKFEMYRYKLWESREDQNNLTIACSREELVPGATVLDDWMLDVSQFPPAEHYKVRLPISGKGYTIRFGLRCASAVDYKLLTLSYVYRELNAR